MEKHWRQGQAQRHPPPRPEWGTAVLCVPTPQWGGAELLKNLGLPLAILLPALPPQQRTQSLEALGH